MEKYIYRGKLDRVVDGDTIDAHIDLGFDISVKKRIRGYFRLKSYGVGKYGRVLGEIFIMDNNDNTICINNQLISEGHAYVYDGGKKKLLKEVNNG